MTPQRKRNLFLFIAFAIVILTAAVFKLCGGQYQSPYGTAIATFCMLAPMISMMIVQAMAHEPLFRSIGISWKVNRWWFVGWLIIPVGAIAALGINILMPGSQFSTHTPLVEQALEQMAASGLHTNAFGLAAVTTVSGLFAGATINALFAFGEESGWRGFLLQQMKHEKFLKVALFTGVIWGLWHAPLILLGHNYPAHPVAGVAMMVLFCVAMTPLITYIRIKSHSVIAAAIVHGTTNALFGLSIPFLLAYNDLLAGIAGLGSIVALLIADAALYLYDRYVSRQHIFTSVIAPHLEQ